MQPTTKGDKIFANINNATVYKTTSISDPYDFVGIEPKKPVFAKSEQIGVYTGIRQTSRDVVWYGVTWIHKYRKLSLGGTRVLPVMQYTDYTEARSGWVKGSDVYAEAKPVIDPPTQNTENEDRTTDDENGNPVAPKTTGAASGGITTTNKTLTTVLYVTISALITVVIMIIFRKPQKQE
jgi:hypothetical protein